MTTTALIPTAYETANPHPILTFDRVNGEGVFFPATGHAIDCWESGCDDCQLHIDGCPCIPCCQRKIADAERYGFTFDVDQHWDMVNADILSGARNGAQPPSVADRTY